MVRVINDLWLLVPWLQKKTIMDITYPMAEISEIQWLAKSAILKYTTVVYSSTSPSIKQDLYTVPTVVSTW